MGGFVCELGLSDYERCASIKKRMSFRLERSGMEESSHFELVQYTNRCEGPSAASAPNGSDSGRDDMGFLEVLGCGAFESALCGAKIKGTCHPDQAERVEGSTHEMGAKG